MAFGFFYLIYLGIVVGFIFVLWSVSKIVFWLRWLIWGVPEVPALAINGNGNTAGSSSPVRGDNIELMFSKQNLGKIRLNNTTTMDEEEAGTSGSDGDNNDVENQQAAKVVVAEFQNDDGKVVKLEDPACPICLVDYEKGNYVQRSASCNHMFHESCIRSWVIERQKKECPCCRRNFALLAVSGGTCDDPTESTSAAG